MLYKNDTNERFLVCNEYVPLYFNSSFEKRYHFNDVMFLYGNIFKSFNMSKFIYTSQILMIYLKLGGNTDIA